MWTTDLKTKRKGERETEMERREGESEWTIPEKKERKNVDWIKIE